MRFHASPTLVMLALALALTLTLVPPVEAPPTYTLTVNPSVMNLGSTTTLTLAISNAADFTAYSSLIEVRKPNATGRAVISRTILTDGNGRGTTTFAYPDASYTALRGTVATDVVGIYDVIANQTSPTNIGIVAVAQFTVSSQLTVVISQPSAGSLIQRGQKVTVGATVSDLRNVPVSPASVIANSPTYGSIVLSQGGPGVYVASYEVQMSDSIGSWVIRVEARDFRGNSGTSSSVSVSIIRSDLIVEGLATYNLNGAPSTDFSPGDTIYPFFKIRYSTGSFLQAGQFKVGMKNPFGSYVANLTAIYDSGRSGFLTPTGYAVSAFDPPGTWSVVVETNSINDGFGNTGPGFPTSTRVQVAVATSAWGYLPFIIGGIIAILSGLIVFKRYGMSTTGFEYLEQLMGGGTPRGSTLLLLGDAGSGKTILSYQLLNDELEARRQCALLSYDAFPEDVHARMREFGWDVIPHLRKGRLKMVDCYSGLAGEGEGAIREPSDLTEINIQVTSFIANAKGAPVTLVLDSLTPIFNGVEAKQAIAFVQTLGAKVKKTGGLFIMTASVGAVPVDSISKIKSIVDGVIELTLTRMGRRVFRYLSVIKMERRKISSEAVPFEIDRKRGLVFRVSRFKFPKGLKPRPPTPPQTEPETRPRMRREIGNSGEKRFSPTQR